MDIGYIILMSSGFLGVVALLAAILSALNGLWLPLAVWVVGIVLYGIAWSKR